MVYIELNGRTGNHLFYIATAASLAKANNDDFAVVCHDDYVLEPNGCSIYEYIQPFKDTIFKDIRILKERPKEIDLFQQIGSLYAPIEYRKNIYLRGLFQSEKYFNNEVVREIFRIPKEIEQVLRIRYEGIINKDITSIHIRRGDYLKLPHQYNITSLSYFRKAIKIIGKRKEYLIISDDIEWCKRVFKGNNFHFASNDSPLEDLYLQTMCTNNIISNSTFSWWGAWLNENPQKNVIAPTPWYSYTLSHMRTDDLIPESWILVKNTMTFYMHALAFYKMAKEGLKKITHVTR